MLDQRNIVIGMLTAAMMNKKVAQHVHAIGSTISRLRTKSRQTGSVKKSTWREDIDDLTSPKRNRFSSSTRIPGLVRNVTVTRIFAKTYSKATEWYRLH